jgi:hypothetical protein
VPQLSLASTIGIRPDVIRREVAGESVLLDLETGLYFGLDATSTRAWELLQAHGALRRVYDLMLAEFDVDGERLERDLIAFVADLTGAGLASLDAAPPAS